MMRMNQQTLNSLLSNTNSFQELINIKKPQISINGLCGSALSVLLASYTKINRGVHIVILDSKDSAGYLDNDLNQFMDSSEVAFFPSSFKKSILYPGDDPSGLIQRISLLNRIKSISKDENLVICTYPDAIGEKVVSTSVFDQDLLKISVNQTITIDKIQSTLFEFAFSKVDFVYEPGQFSIRGGIVDIFSYANNLPYRLDFFGDEISTIRTFDVATQRSDNKIDSVVIVPNLSSKSVKNSRISLIEFVKDCNNPNLTLWIDSPKDFLSQLSQTRLKLVRKLLETGSKADESARLVLGESELLDVLKGTSIFTLKDSFPQYPSLETICFNTSVQPKFDKSFDALAQDIENKNIEGYKVYLLTKNKAQVERLENIFNSIGKDSAVFENLPIALRSGYIDHDLKIALYTDHQIFERYHRYKINNELQKSQSITISELNALEMGDYVVHIDYGIGKFGGLVKSVEGGKTHETIRLIYKDNDTLFVNIQSIHKISKYRDKDSAPPAIHKLGTSTWSRFKSNAKNKVKDIAKDLIALYAKRKQQKGFAFSKSSYLQKELEASFIYEDTPDQEKATLAIHKNMESQTPMDMLICGDVGFGKTEVAMRAAFKAVCDSKQVAVLVPTTILALQHYRTFSRRLKSFPVNIESVSRTKTTKQLNDIVDRLKAGKIDILIGTHKILNSSIEFKDLGLLIIDEEQKFGVSSKEKLRTIKSNIDTLTLTATPIPRTLQFSLMGARDLVVINTPPPNRQPVTTLVQTFDNELLKEAIDFEISRSGQVFVIHNRVDSIYHMAEVVRQLCPDARIAVGHGQMKPSELEQIMMDFIYGEIDVFVATTIIESGIDIPNANTMIINDAQNFGLSELHQLRGRVGRTNTKAFCYLFTPSSGRISVNAEKRLKAIEDFSDLGSGLSIAMQDLDIRGAGNILGAEQSGFISEIGYETYYKILSEAMIELKQEAHGDDDSIHDFMPNRINYISDCQIEIDLEALIPETYVQNLNEKMRFYRAIDMAESPRELKEIRESMIDRFGELPSAVNELLNIVQIRSICRELGFEKAIIKNGYFIVHLIYNQQSPYYKSELFNDLMKFVSEKGDDYKFKSVKDTLLITMRNVSNTDAALEIITNIKNTVVK